MNENDILDDIPFEDEDHITEVSDEEKFIRAFIQRNADAYISFKKQQKNISFDFLKMLVGIPWLLYRKIYIPAIVSMFFLVPMQTFSLIPVFQLLTSSSRFENLDFNDTFTYLYLSPTLIVMIVCGFFSHSIYLNHVENKIHRLKKENLDQEEFLELLKEKGGVDGVSPMFLIFIIAVAFLSYLSTGKFNPILVF